MTMALPFRQKPMAKSKRFLPEEIMGDTAASSTEHRLQSFCQTLNSYWIHQDLPYIPIMAP